MACHLAYKAPDPNAFPCRWWAHWAAAPCSCFRPAGLIHGAQPPVAQNNTVYYSDDTELALTVSKLNLMVFNIVFVVVDVS